MSLEAIYEAMELGKRMRYVYVATADLRGLPHLASAGIINM